ENTLCGAKSADSETAKRSRPEACSLRQCPFENSICLVAFRAHRFDKAIDHDVVFQRHAQLPGEAASTPFGHYSQHEHLGNTGTAIFFNHAQRNEPSGPDLLLVIKQSQQSEWEQ